MFGDGNRREKWLSQRKIHLSAEMSVDVENSFKLIHDTTQPTRPFVQHHGRKLMSMSITSYYQKIYHFPFPECEHLQLMRIKKVFKHSLLVFSGLSNGAIRSIRLVIEPVGVRRGQSATLRCLYDLDGAPLMSLQFYRGSGEFYRYSPGQTPTKKVFPLSGINVDVSEYSKFQMLI